MSVHRYSGTVIDNQTQAGVSGAWVEALACGGDGREVVAAGRTGTRGEFTLNVTDDELAKLFGAAIPHLFFRVRQGDDVLASTARSLEWDPRRNGSGVIPVDLATPVATIAPSTYSVHGTVADIDAGPLASTQVAVYRQKLSTAGVAEEALISTTSSPTGHYRIEYAAPTNETADRDIILKALDGSSNVIATVTLKNAPPRAVVDLVAGGTPGKNYPGPTRYADTLSRVTSHTSLLDPPPALKDLTPEQIEFLARQTRTPKEEVQSLVDAANLAAESGVISTETFFALVRSGLPATTEELFLHKTSDLVAAVKKAVGSRVVSPDVIADPVTLTNQLRDAGVAVLRTPVTGGLRLGTLVDDSTTVPPAEATAFLELALSHEGSTTSFWEAVDDPSSPFTAAGRKGLRFAVEIGAISGAFLPVVEILHARVADVGDPLTDDPVALAEYDVTAWRTLIESIASGPHYPDDTPPLPTDDPPGTESQRRDAYAKQLARNVEQRFRTPVISARIRKDQSGSGLATFFTDHAAFDFFETRVDTYLIEQSIPLDETVKDQLKEIERTAKITETWEETKELIDADYKSSSSIEDAGREKFKADVVGSSIDEQRAEEIYENACWTVESVTALRAMYASATNAVNTAVTPDKAKGSKESLHPALADWTTLFGAPHACICEHCRSVYGPAAYLADVLQLLKKVPGSSGTGRDVIFQRRPDLPILALSCTNAETALPYVDLVNEILEVKTAVSSWPATPVRVDTSHTTDELLAEPELIYPNEHLAAYGVLAEAVYPFALPFHLYQEEARIYLEHLGVRRAELLSALAPLGGAPDARHLALERLGTSGLQLDIITSAPVEPPQEYWGLTSNYPAALASAKTFLERSGLSFGELQELLTTAYCTTHEIAFAGDPPPCDLDELTLTNLGGPSDAHHQFLHRFLRLRNVLGWSISDTDKACTALGAVDIGTLDTAVLETLGGIRELQRIYKVEPAELLAWYSRLDRNGAFAPSLFERVYLDKRVAAPTDATFKEVFDTDTSTVVIESVRAGLAAALRLSAADLALLTDPTAADLALRLLPVAPPSDLVGIENLSRLYRVVSFARAARMPLPELLLLRELSGENALTGDDPNPSNPATPDGTLAFLDTVARARALPMPLEEIHYLLRHVALEGSPLLLDAEEDLIPWREELEYLVKTAADEAAQIEDSNGSVLFALAENLVEAELLTTDDLDYLKLLLTEPANMGVAPIPTAADFITNTLAPFLAGSADPVEDAKTFLKITPPPIPPITDTELPARCTYLARHFHLYLSTRAIVKDWVAQKFQVEADAAAQLVGGNVLAFGALAAVDAFVPRITWDTPQSDDQTREDLLVRIQKAAIFARRFALTADEIAAFYPASAGALPKIDWNEIPIAPPAVAGPIGSTVQTDFDALLAIGDLIALRDKWAAGSESLFRVIALAAGGATIETVVAAASLGAQWVQTDVDALRGSPPPLPNLLAIDVPSFASGAALVRIDEALAVVKRLGVPAAFLGGWINVEIAIPSLPTDPTPNALTVARDIRRAARAKHDEGSWTNVARPLRNALREKQRNALVGHLIAQSPTLATPDDLYADLLIDVQMDPCALTSRLVLAHSSCQLFIQRIQMNLENGADLSPNIDLGLQWDWMKNYRVWEANRKVFLWPENWIEPDLRDDKSPLFKDLERALLSGPIDNAAAEEAYRTYLDGLADLSNLEIIAMHVEERNSSESYLHSVILHVFGRTRKSPVYYYRRRELGSWTAWEKVDAPIEGDHLMPFAYGGRLYLAWAVMEEVDREPRASDDDIVMDPAKLDQTQARLIMKHLEAMAQSRWDLIKPLTKALALVTAAIKNLQEQAARNPPVELSVKLAVSELRAGGWTAPLESEGQLLGASPRRAALSFRTEVGKESVLFTMAVVGTKFDDSSGSERTVRALEFTFYPGTNSHTVAAPLAVIVDSMGLYPSQLIPEFVPPFQGQTVMRPFTGPDDDLQPFSEISYQAFAGPALGPLRLLLWEDGANNPFAKILDSGVTTRTRIVADRVPETVHERDFLIMQDGRRSFTLELGTRKPGQTQLSFSPPTSYSNSLPQGEREYRFDLFYHPYVNRFRHVVASNGVETLLRPALQAQAGLQYWKWDLTPTFFQPWPYEPHDHVEQSQPFFLEEVDFRHGSAFGVYNWELFFHIPLMIADHLASEGRHDEAQRWLHTVFDPTDGKPGQGAARYWKFKPFADNVDLATIQEQLENLTANTYAQQMQVIMGIQPDSAAAKVLAEQIEAWRHNPFDPHLLARMRTVAYQKTLVMRYIDNLIAWGDKLFARDSIESINEATQLYILALEILGPKPTLIPDPEPPTPQSYDELDTLSAFDAFSNALVATEVLAPKPPKNARSTCRGRVPPPKIVWGSPYFCVPPNEKLLGYWDTVADRLFKIRNCMNIEGVVRTLPLFEPPIDPALLVRAKAAGVDLSSVLFDISAAAPPYRYGVLYGKAVEIASSVASLGATLLSALEKHDGELLAELRQRHEVATQQAILETRRAQVREAQESLRATERSLKLAQERFDYYSSRETINAPEQAALDLRARGQVFSAMAQDLHTASSTAALLPDFEIGIAGLGPMQTTTIGGTFVSKYIEAQASSVQAHASALMAAGDMVSTVAGYGRRKEDWEHQAKLARLEIVQIERQIEAARIRLEIARSEVATVQRQISQSQEVERFLQRKFTNQELYGWMKVEIAKVYYQAYKLAFDIAKRAEKAFQYERGDTDQTFIQFGYWDSLKKGLLAGERLLHDLRRMDATYLAQNKRELELVKMVSLAEHDPDQLVELRETGMASFGLIEDDFDRDFDTHYMRRLKSVTVTVPCTVGPYQGVHGTLTFLRGATRKTKLNTEDLDDTRGVIEQVATSHAQSDGGVFELNFRDERILPFEGAGAHLRNDQLGSKSWSFSLTKGNRFSFDSIDDLVLDIRYTAREGRTRKREANRTYKRLVRVRSEHADAWRAFMQNGASGIAIPLPYASWSMGGDEGNTATAPEVDAVTIYAWWSGATSPTVTLANPEEGVELTGPSQPNGASRRWTGDPGWALTPAAADVWTLTPDQPNKTFLTDVWIVFDYTVEVDG